MSALYIDAIVYCVIALAICVFFVFIVAIALAPINKDDGPRGGGMCE